MAFSARKNANKFIVLRGKTISNFKSRIIHISYV